MDAILLIIVLLILIYLIFRPAPKPTTYGVDDIQHPCDIQSECRLPFMKRLMLPTTDYYYRDVQMPYWIGVQPWTAEESTGVRFHFINDRCHGVSNFGDDGAQIWSDTGWSDPDLAWCDFVRGYGG